MKTSCVCAACFLFFCFFVFSATADRRMRISWSPIKKKLPRGAPPAASGPWGTR